MTEVDVRHLDDTAVSVSPLPLPPAIVCSPGLVYGTGARRDHGAGP